MPNKDDYAIKISGSAELVNIAHAPFQKSIWLLTSVLSHEGSAAPQQQEQSQKVGIMKLIEVRITTNRFVSEMTQGWLIFQANSI